MTDDSGTLQVSVLGELILHSNGQVLKLPTSRKTRALLAYLALNRRPLRRTVLCELLWDRTDDPRAALRWSLTKLRALLGDALVTNRETVKLGDQVSLDLEQLHELLGNDVPNRLQRLLDLESSMGSEYLPGIDVASTVEYELWLESERARLRNLHGQLLRRLQQLTADDPGTALHFARRRVGIDSTDIPANIDVLALLLQQQGLEPARRAFDQCRARLQAARIDDSSLLQGWHTLSQPPSTATGAITPGRLAVNQPGASDNALLLPGKPSLAVLGFQDIGSDANDVLGRGLTADLISRLSRVGGLFVIARASSTRFAPEHYDYPDIGRLLGVRYLVHGSIQRRQQQLRLNVELIDASLSRSVWVETFEHSRDDLFLLQDELANAIVSAIEPAMERAEYERARLKNPASLDAWENYHMALWHSFRFTSANTEAASHFLQKALKLDPQFSRAHAALSLTHFSRAFLNSGKDIDKEIEQALATAEHSVNLDGRDAMGHWSLGRAQFLHRQHDLALTSLDRALQTNPNYAQGHYARGFISAHSGVAAQAIPELETAQRLSPFDPLLFAMISSRAVSLAMQDQYEEAADWAVRATLEANAHFHIHAIAAACLQLAGRREAASYHAGIVLNRHPGYCQDIFFRSFPYKYAEQQQRMAAALKAAGLP